MIPSICLTHSKLCKVNVKHEDATHLPGGGPRCIFSSNYLKKCAGWESEDIEALYDRRTKIAWARELPGEMRTQAARAACRRCSVAYLAECSAKLKVHLEQKLGPQTDDHTSKSGEPQLAPETVRGNQSASLQDYTTSPPRDPREAIPEEEPHMWSLGFDDP